MENDPLPMNYQYILKTIPHRYPFLFVDGITACDYANSASGYKNITLNEMYLSQTSQGKASFPESLVTECMAQVGAVAILSVPENSGKIMLFAAVENLRFHHPVYPGDQLVSHIQRISTKKSLGKMKAAAYVSTRMVAEGEFTYALIDKRA